MTGSVGQSVAVLDAPARVTGSLGYVLDMVRPRMLAGRMLRSPYPHARLVAVDTRRAAAMPGVFAVLTGEDVAARLPAGGRFGRFFYDQTVLATGRSRFVGEPVAAVAAASAELAAEACLAIEVEYDPLPAVFTVEEAIAPGAPLVHETRPELRGEFADMIGVARATGNVCSYFRLRHGAIDEGLAGADHVFTDTFRSPAVQHVPLEPHVALAEYDGKLTVWSATQMPHAVRAQLAELLGMRLSDVRVLTTNLGGGFGAKGSLRLEPLAALLAAAARRPVKIILDREEEFVTVTKHAAVVEITSGVDRDGYLVARKVVAHYNTGAYADVGPMVARNAGAAITGPYRIPHVAVDSHAVWTNLVPAGAFRGFGVAQGAWAYESHTDMVAARLGIDPVVFRRQNLLRSGDRHATGEKVDHLHFDRLVDAVTGSIGWDGPGPRSRGDGIRRGKAVTAMMKATITPSTSTAAVRLDEDGNATVLTSSVDLGQGAKTVLAQIVADALTLPYAAVGVSDPDTALTPYDQQTSSSRTTFSMGTAAARAAQDVARQLLAMAVERLEAAPEDLELVAGGVQVRGAPARRVGIGELMRSSRRGSVQGNGSFVTEGGLDPETGQGVGSVHWHHGVGGCEVEVDPETGKVEVVSMAAAVFAGRVVNPRLAELQVEGSLLFGLGQALFEEIAFGDGQVVNPNLSDYMIPSFADLPGAVHVTLLEDLQDGEIHGIGETSLPPVSPMIANAIFDAVGARVTDLPVTPEKVLRMLAGGSGDLGGVPDGEVGA